MDPTHRIGEYLIERLQAHGVEHVFGVPGDYVLGFMDLLTKSSLQLINTCDEQGAGFAADAYARLRGLGVVCITYCVGGLKIANTTAQAYAERSPVVVISGSPGAGERARNPLLHHTVRTFETQLRVFEQITGASTVLLDPGTALAEIDRVLNVALRQKLPVYIEIPRDLYNSPASHAHPRVTVSPEGDPEALREALAEAAEKIRAARQPVILAGEQLHRFALQKPLLALLARSGIPFATTLLSKSVLEEDHPSYIGVYSGGISRSEVVRYVEESDCLLMLGSLMTDINLGIYTANLSQRRTVYADSERVAVGYHRYENVLFEDFVRGLAALDLPQRSGVTHPRPETPSPFVPEPGRPLTVARLFQCLNACVDKQTVVLADPGDAMLGSMDLLIDSEAQFLAPAYYTSLGFAVPGALGAQFANTNLRPLVLVGDGAFQMTGMELATIARYGLDPIVVVLNNRGYGTERPMLDGSFNDVLNWHYSRLPDFLGAGIGFDVHTEDELEYALGAAIAYRDGFSILDVHLDPSDRSPALDRLTEALGRRVRV